MKDPKTDGRLQVTAAAALLRNSMLVEWNPELCKFVPVPREVFASSWREVDPVFGRLICWISFAAGAEFLAKGTCLVRGVEIRRPVSVPAYPVTDVELWAPGFRKDYKSGGTVITTHFGTLVNLYGNRKKKNPAALCKLCSTVGATPEETDLLLAGFELLGRSIRNRDAHAYLPNERDSHFELVSALFAPCFNILVSWLPGGPSTLNLWQADAEHFIAAV